jgi:hypothetical protein
MYLLDTELNRLNRLNSLQIHFLHSTYCVKCLEPTFSCFTDTDEKHRYEIKDILEMEMKILEALNYYLVVFHPYRALSQ